jgi:hypothetical protein
VQRPSQRYDLRFLPLPIPIFFLLVLGLVLALHYPLKPAVAATLFLLACAGFFIRDDLWLLVLPALLPVFAFAPWTGWITFEELDLLVLATATGAYAHAVWRSLTPVQRCRIDNGEYAASPLWWLLAALFAASTATAMARGFLDAGGFSFGWFQGYHEPMNSVRLAKCFFLATLLIPLWSMNYRHAPERALQLLSTGLMLGLAGAALATVWEREAFTNLLNFSTDYRTTGLFWEMHVGGAALDGFLALTIPFALRELLAARTTLRWSLAAAVLALAGYSALTTFSRGVYLAVPVGAAVFLALHLRQKTRLAPLQAGGDAKGGTHSVLALLPALLLLVGFGLGASWIFQTSGYRGMAAWLGTVALLLPMARVLRSMTLKQWMTGLVLSLPLLLLAYGMARLVPKGAYFAWALAALLTIGMLVLVRRAGRPSMLASVTALASFTATAAATALVAEHWGGAAGLAHAAPVVLAGLSIGAAVGAVRRPVWPDKPRWQATIVGCMAMLAVMVGVFEGGAYMGDRFSTGGQDVNDRFAHWQIGRNMLQTRADWWLGKGMGRFPANYILTGDPEHHPGDYRIKTEGDNNYLTLAGGLHVIGWGEALRVTQRISEPGAHAIVTARVRTDKDVALHFEVCEKHLLYSFGCFIAKAYPKGAPGVWQPVRVELSGGPVTRGKWYAPKILGFSVAVESRGGIVDVDDLQLTRADGHPLLSNGDFSESMTHWFFSSDRYHLPWHIKNVFMNVLFDQGVVGLTLWCALLAGALWRTSLGAARLHPLAPSLAASLSGFVVVGLFDSLLDVPRVAWLFYFLLLVALTLRVQVRPLAAKYAARAAASGALTVALVCWSLQPGEAQATQAEPARPVLRVGPAHALKTIAQASKVAKSGDVIEVDAGDYVGDVAVWTQDGLTLRAVGGRVRLLANGVSAEGKGIWVIRAKHMRVEGFDFEGAAVPSRNGAGIRLDSGSLFVRDCRFLRNEMGLLTNNDPDTVLEIEDSEFAYNMRPDGHNHNLYAGQIAKLSVTGSYFHHARTGHLLKSRAAVSYIYNNRLIDGPGGTASYELEFPNGGVATVVGNVIGQNLQTENPKLISFGAEGYKWPRNAIHLEGNTLINPLPYRGVFLYVAPGADAISATNNRLVGEGTLESAGAGEYRNNVALDPLTYERGANGAAHNPGAMRTPTPPPAR